MNFASFNEISKLVFVEPDWLEVSICFYLEYIYIGVYIVNMKTFNVSIFGRNLVLSLLKSHNVS